MLLSWSLIEQDYSAIFLQYGNHWDAIRKMSNSEEDCFIDLSMFGSFNSLNKYIIIFSLISLIVARTIIFFISLFRQQALSEGIIFIIFIFVLSTSLWYQSRRLVTRLQINGENVNAVCSDQWPE